VIPDAEADLLSETVMRAVEAASVGALAAGYDPLLAGRRHAEALLNRGEPYAAELVAWWRGALSNYCDSYGVPLE
jgi:hypothetical protein